MALSVMLSTVLLALPQLNADELKVVRSRVGASSSLAGSSTVEATLGNGGDYLLEGLCQELRRRGALGREKRLPARLIPQGYAEKAADVRDYFAKHLGTLSAGELSALGQLMGEALALYLEKRGVPIAPSTLLNNISKVPTAVDAAFPGYLEAGVLSSCWRRQA